MSKRKLDLKGALECIKKDCIPRVLSWDDDKLAGYLASLLFRYVHSMQPHLAVPLTCLGTWKDLGVACVPEARILLKTMSIN